jgi:S-methylmethionine-dependent homocysteine/selenocysteine methylase
VIEEATKQIIEEVAQELFAKGIDKQMTLTSQKMLAKKPEIMYTIYNEYVKKKRRNYC